MSAPHHPGSHPEGDITGVPDKSKRPLSPHLQIYKLQLTSMLSIMHRASGFVLCFAAIALAMWIIGLAYGPDVFNQAAEFYKTPFGQIIFSGFIAAFFYHFCNGIRHLFWDGGYGFDLPTLYRTGYIVLGTAAVLTIGYLALLGGLL